MIQLEKITKKFDQQVVLNAINLHIPKQSIYGIIGLSGAGKTTLLRCLNGLELIDDGVISVEAEQIQQLNAQQLRQYQRRVGMIFQHFNLLQSKTVYDNVALALKLEGQKKKDYDPLVREMLDFVGLLEFANKYPSELSGGQKQRVGIARALVHKPKLLLCDEATSALDPKTSKTILQLLQTVNQTYHVTIVLITHQMEVIREICDRVAVLEQGKIVEEGSVFDVFTHPKEHLTKSFVSPLIQQTLPSGIREQLINPEAGICYRLTFNKNNVAQPILSQVTQQNNVHSNILFGALNEIQQRFFGQLTVEFIGEDPNVAQTLHELKQQGVDIETINVLESEVA